MKRIKRRILPLLLAMMMVIGLVPATAEAAEPRTNEFSMTLGGPGYVNGKLQYWQASVTGEGYYTGTLTIATGHADVHPTPGESYDLTLSAPAIDGFTPQTPVILVQEQKEFAGVKIGITEKSAQEIADYVNGNITYSAARPQNSYVGSNLSKDGYTSLTGTFTSNAYQPPVAENVKVSVNMSGDDAKGGKVVVDGKELTSNGASVEVAKGSTPTVVFKPDADYYVSGCKIGEDVALWTGEGDKTITLTDVQTATDVVITPAFAKVEPEPENPADYTEGGNLAWTGGVKDKLTYTEALQYNFNVTAGNSGAKLLNSNFGKSWTYGVDLLENPTIFATAKFNNGTPITVGTDLDSPKDLGKLGGQKPAADGQEINVGAEAANKITAEQVVPGTFTQEVYMKYYTASSVCGAHWYHVGGVEYHKDKLERTINISKDTLTLSGVKDSYVYTDGLTIKPVLTPASKGVTGSKAVVDEGKVTITDNATGKTPVFDKAGEYTITIKYPGDDYIEKFSEEITIVVTRAENTEYEVESPEVIDITATSFGLDNLVVPQWYKIEGVTDEWKDTEDGWVAGDDERLEKIEGLTPGKPYTIQTKLPETDQYKEKLGTPVEATTLSVLYGKVTSDFKPADLPATVTVTPVDAKAGEPTVIKTEEDGTYSIELPAGDYTVSALGKDGYQAYEAEAEGVVKVAGETEYNFAMTDTAKGKAKKFIDDHHIDEGKKPITGIPEDIIKMILESEDDYNNLPEDVKDEIDKLLEPDTYKGILDKLKKHMDDLEQQAAEEAAKKKAEEAAKKVGAVKTGDTSNTGMYLSLTFISALLIAVLAVFKKRLFKNR